MTQCQSISTSKVYHPIILIFSKLTKSKFIRTFKHLLSKYKKAGFEVIHQKYGMHSLPNGS